MNPRKDVIFNIFNERERILFFKYINLYYLNVNKEEITSLKVLESFDLKFNDLFNFIKTLNLPKNLSPYILASAIYNTKKEFYEKKSLKKSEESLKRKGRLPTKKVWVERRTKSGNVIKYQTTVYVRPEKLNDKLRKIGMEDSYKRFLASSYYKEDIFKNKYENKYKQLLKENKFNEIGKLMKDYFKEIKVDTMDKYTKNEKLYKELIKIAEKTKYNLINSNK